MTEQRLTDRLRGWLRVNRGHGSEQLIRDALDAIIRYERKLSAVSVVYDAVRLTSDERPDLIPSKIADDLKEALES